MQNLYDFGGVPDAPLLHIAHANGFHPATYAPLAAPLARSYHVLGLAARPLWPGQLPQKDKTWRLFADDFIDGLEELGAGGVIGVGHSMGGVTTLLAAIDRPDLFRAIILLDPVLLPPGWLLLQEGIRRLRLPWQPSLVKRALCRHRTWPDRQSAYEYFHKKPFFASWQEAALRAYVEHGTRPTADGQVTLAYPPEWEAHIFGSVPTDIWQFVSRLNSRLPVLFARGERSETFRPDALARAARLLPHARVATIPHAGHMFPLEHSAETAALILSFLTQKYAG